MGSSIARSVRAAAVIVSMMIKSTIADNVQVALACTAPTEAAVYSLIVSVFIYRELTLKDLVVAAEPQSY